MCRACLSRASFEWDACSNVDRDRTYRPRDLSETRKFEMRGRDRRRKIRDCVLGIETSAWLVADPKGGSVVSMLRIKAACSLAVDGAVSESGLAAHFSLLAARFFAFRLGIAWPRALVSRPLPCSQFWSWDSPRIECGTLQMREAPDSRRPRVRFRSSTFTLPRVPPPQPPSCDPPRLQGETSHPRTRSLILSRRKPVNRKSAVSHKILGSYGHRTTRG